jgi:hypothetical protein
MPSKKKTKGVLERIGDAASSAAEVVINAGSKAVHAVGDMMPIRSTPKGAKASSKAAQGKTSKSAPKAKASKSKKVAAKKKTAALSNKKAGSKKVVPSRSATPAPSTKRKRQAGKKG